MVERGNWALGIRFFFFDGGKGLLLTFIAYTSSLFQIEFLPNTKIKTQDKTKQKKTTEIRFCINRLVGLSLSLSHSLYPFPFPSLCYFSLFLHFSIILLHIDYCATFQSFRDWSSLKRVECLLKMPYKMFGIMKSYYIKPDQT